MSEHKIDWKKHLQDEKISKVLYLADEMIKGEDMPLEVVERVMKQLSGYAIHISWAAGVYKGERAKLQYDTQCSVEGTGVIKESEGKRISAELRIKEESTERISKAMIQAAQRLDTILREGKKDKRYGRGAGEVPVDEHGDNQ